MEKSRKVLSLVPPFSKEDLHRDCAAVLDAALADNYDSVIVFGFKDHQVRTRTSKSVNALELVGALEAAKREIWK